MITVDVVCCKYKPLKNGELPIKIKVCKDRCTWLKKNMSCGREGKDWQKTPLA